jgi:hypothetical protein
MLDSTPAEQRSHIKSKTIGPPRPDPANMDFSLVGAQLFEATVAAEMITNKTSPAAHGHSYRLNGM